MKYCNPMVTQYIEVLQSYGNPNTLKCFNILKCFNLMKVTIGLQHFNILGYHRIAILQYIANYLFLQRTLSMEKIWAIPWHSLEQSLTVLQLQNRGWWWGCITTVARFFLISRHASFYLWSSLRVHSFHSGSPTWKKIAYLFSWYANLHNFLISSAKGF